MDQIIRVILHGDRSIHIAMDDRKSVVCTANALASAISDPYGFIDKGKYQYKDTTRLLNKDLCPLNLIPGLTLMTVYKDRSVSCEFPELYPVFFRAIKDPSIADTCLTMNDFAEDKSFFDEKQFFVKFYLDFASGVPKDIDFMRHSHLDQETQTHIVQEIINTFLSKTKKKESLAPAANERVLPDEVPAYLALATSEPDNPNKIPSHYVTTVEYAKIHNYKANTVRSWCMRETLRSVVHDEKGRVWIDPNDQPIDRRKERRSGAIKASGKRQNTLKANYSYLELQEYIANRHLVSDQIRPFFRSQPEILFFYDRRYHEVDWTEELPEELRDNPIFNLRALIIDVNLDYFCKQMGMTNREIILSGGAPVVPVPYDDVTSSPDFFHPRYHLHHIGQKAESPIAIVAEKEHNSEEYYSILHEGSFSGEDLHGANFEKRKELFWKTYVRIIDRFGSYRKVPYLNKDAGRYEKNNVKEAC